LRGTEIFGTAAPEKGAEIYERGAGGRARREQAAVGVKKKGMLM